MDGLMLDTERIYYQAWAQAMSEEGYELTDRFYCRIMGKKITDIRNVFRNEFGPDIPVETIIKLKQKHVAEALYVEGVPVKAGLLDLLDQLDAWKIPKAVASSTARGMVLDILTQAEISTRFDVIVGGDDVPMSKPAPDLFLAAAERLGVPAAGCVVLEDSEAGIRAAHAAGMFPIMVPDLLVPGEEIKSMAGAVLPTLDHAREYLGILGRFIRPPSNGIS